MKLLISGLFPMLLSSAAFGSALVCINGDQLEVYSNLIFYGSKAQELGPGCAQEIYRMFNQPEVKVKVKGKDLKVKFKISYQVENEVAVYSSVNINTRVANNYIRIEDQAYTHEHGRSNHILGGNCGYYAEADELGTSSTCAHEFGHGLGLTHYNERKSGYGSNNDLRGAGRPGIMAKRGYIVDPQFQWNPKARAGDPGGTVKPHHRVVRKEDILDLKLHALKFNSAGCAELGRANGFAYTKDGKRTSGDNSYLFDALNYIQKDVMGTVGKPIYCK